jgi:N-acetylglutamate synthase-like GNAT family acetyltransferase
VIAVRAAEASDLPWIRELFDRRWGGQEQVENGDVYRPSDLPGFIATIADEPVGYAALRIVDDMAEIGVVDAIRPRIGIGTRLVAALEVAARSHGLRRFRAVTTNENLEAQAFYAALGFQLVDDRPRMPRGSRSWPS